MQQIPTHAERLARLFDFFRDAGEDELSHQAAATMIGQRLGHRVDPSILDRARSGEAPLPDEIGRELCQLMNVPAFYLSGTEDHSVILSQHQTLHLWCLIRDRGVKSLIARNVADAQMEQRQALIQALTSMSVPPRSAPTPHHLEVVS